MTAVEVCIMQETTIVGTPDKKNTITSRVFCVNTGHTYVYELLNGEIVSEEKVLA
ncbi:hypothetical protein [Methanocella sp. MCL-LM]|uniref:hypothetical protein n=1 Tax=Methanocella sp. MCL-LM TaxID=3412035 RepID=UPI003C78BB0B